MRKILISLEIWTFLFSKPQDKIPVSLKTQLSTHKFPCCTLTKFSFTPCSETVEGLWQMVTRESFNVDLSLYRLGKSSALRTFCIQNFQIQKWEPQVTPVPANPHPLELTYFDKGFINIQHGQMITFLHSKLSVLPGLQNRKYHFIGRLILAEIMSVMPSSLQLCISWGLLNSYHLGQLLWTIAILY